MFSESYYKYKLTIGVISLIIILLLVITSIIFKILDNKNNNNKNNENNNENENNENNNEIKGNEEGNEDKTEGFEEYTSQEDAKEYRKKTNTIGDPFIMKRRAGEIIDIEKQFDNVEVYDNDYDLKTGLTGYDKCLMDETNKACVEYGITGITTGFK
jgi:regulatory protein YycI of two-component signal transduction system YycFG